MPVVVTEEYVSPEVFCEVAGQSIFRVYKNGDTSSPMTFQFSTSSDEGNLRCQFDVRDVAAALIAQEPTYPIPVSQPHGVDHEWTDEGEISVIRDALSHHLLPMPDEMDDWWQNYTESGAVHAIDENDLPDHDLPDG
ncbi:hypothetical protein [Phormidium tenue]|uniref:Uncharacterized protein n=1 Tax=Phormidium tenue NIES-30 TaxID=549789 RepID=A0A1U7IYW6_9CYAN|nr:hypothetical protein [Phormidium tenue]MBD2234680.1 hypothetical protein [Phormidium tenue FACHB-1052]OKH44102.1 hypothetical protein NIES30_23540 [Phormidium tenue NIES-30]